MRSTSENIEPIFFNYGNPIVATTVATEPVAATMVNHAAAKLALGTADNVNNHPIEKRLASAAKCPPPPGEDRSCDSVDKSKISSIAVHCSYIWDQGKNHNLLNYKVVINPTGQNTRCWCKQFLAAVRDRCPNGEIEWAYPVFKCNHKHIRNTLGYGIYINFYNNVWVVGEDNRGCIKAAIEDTTCGVPLQLERGGCYKKD
ncbi:hypothetical protein CH63R_13301 [Colletotrichum higginsianum IMI 349063]|uniref:Uncharacterized protein n=2 Tax=Colletotrichum higginsianum TaxID=80884 RepID=A0A1B7XWQ7_COLHI|nr:hypothetical protein CH63R_13301 [Colletotrichum higginsianum IMI 349063]OBR04174.1 hypothetical protein CH63R_13301 [Colletotrichum higginsianum IMI 349063]TIC90325.1 hypothetical protein CH35J_012156 [Colletotrichum higginsianum]